MNIRFILKGDLKSTETKLMHQLMKEMKSLGHNVGFQGNNHECDVVIANGVGVWRQTLEYIESDCEAPLVIYEWDCYPWTYPKGIELIKNKWNGYPVFSKSKYKLILNKAMAIYCPSTSVKKRIDEIFEVGYKCKIIEPFFEQIKGGTTSEKGYIYHPVRKYKDPQLGWLEKFSEIYKIPILRPEHGLSKEEYKKAVLNSSLVLTEYSEASTGGLTLLEAFAREKKILFCDSDYMGANDYFPESVERFKKGSFEDFSSKILKILNEKNRSDQNSIEQIKSHFTPREMAKRLDLQINQLIKEKQ